MLRHQVLRDRFCAFVRIHGVFWGSGFLVYRMVAPLVRSECWKSVGNRTDFCRGLVGLNLVLPGNGIDAWQKSNVLTDLRWLRPESGKVVPDFQIQFYIT